MILSSLLLAVAQTSAYPFNDPALPDEARLTDLVGRLTLSEKIDLLRPTACPAWVSEARATPKASTGCRSAGHG